MTRQFAPHADPAGLTDREFARIARIASAEAGLSLSEGKKPMISSRLARRLRETGHADFETYLTFLEEGDSNEERSKLISALTTNVSHFFREAHHFRTLETEVLRPLADKARAGGRIRLWSAGCSTGQEPYSIAMSVLSVLPEAPRLDIRILASDIDQAVLETARRGVYPERLMDGVDPDMRRRFFATGGEGFTANDDLRSLIAFRRVNLVGQWPFSGPFDAIFCRNVVIYFDVETQAALWPRFHRLLSPRGLLFLGHSERLDPRSAEAFECTGVTTWRKAADVPAGRPLTEGTR